MEKNYYKFAFDDIGFMNLYYQPVYVAHETHLSKVGVTNTAQA